MQYLKEHTFPNGNLLILDVANTYAGLHGLTVYTVFYGDKDNDTFNAVGNEPLMSLVEAQAAFDKRVMSADPSKSSREHGGIHELVLDAFKRYLGEHTLRPLPLPADWAGFFEHVKNSTISNDQHYYNGVKVLEALDGLTTTSSKHSDGRADVVVELPAWKLLEMLTAITALAMALRLSDKPKMRIAA